MLELSKKIKQAILHTRRCEQAINKTPSQWVIVPQTEQVIKQRRNQAKKETWQEGNQQKGQQAISEPGREGRNNKTRKKTSKYATSDANKQGSLA